MDPSLSSNLQPGTVFAGRYRIVRLLKAGGMGAVYVVQHVKTDAHLALKVMRPEIVADESARARFAQEARIGALIESSYVVSVTDADIDASTGIPYLVMELLRGQELGELLAARGRFTPEEVVGWLGQVARALDKAHQRGIVHRDLKPENLFLATSDEEPARIKILDFGIAKILQATRQTTQGTGTPLYMAPEQMSKTRQIGPWSDVWSLGLIAYTCLVGRPYWESEAMYELFGEILGKERPLPSQRALHSGVVMPPGFDAWMLRCLEHEPNARFGSASETILALADALGVQRPSLGGPPAASTARNSPTGTLYMSQPTPAGYALTPSATPLSPYTAQSPHTPPTANSPYTAQSPHTPPTVHSPYGSSPELPYAGTQRPGGGTVQQTPPLPSQYERTPQPNPVHGMHPYAAPTQQPSYGLPTPRPEGSQIELPAPVQRIPSGAHSAGRARKAGIPLWLAAGAPAGVLLLGTVVFFASRGPSTAPATSPSTIEEAPTTKPSAEPSAAPLSLKQRIEKSNPFIPVQGFFLQEHETTHGEYQQWLKTLSPREQAKARPLARLTDAENPDVPVTWVSHARAKRYCQAIGAQLMTLEQWTAALEGHKFPWGNDAPTSTEGLAIGGSESDSPLPVKQAERDVTDTRIHDLFGNVREWLNDVEGGFAAVRGAAIDTPLREAAATFSAHSVKESEEGVAPEGHKEEIAGARIGFRCAR